MKKKSMKAEEFDKTLIMVRMCRHILILRKRKDLDENKNGLMLTSPSG